MPRSVMNWWGDRTIECWPRRKIGFAPKFSMLGWRFCSHPYTKYFKVSFPQLPIEAFDHVCGINKFLVFPVLFPGINNGGGVFFSTFFRPELILPWPFNVLSAMDTHSYIRYIMPIFCIILSLLSQVASILGNLWNATTPS